MDTMQRQRRRIHRVGDIVRITSDNDNYTAMRDRDLRITHVATAYMPAAQFYAQGRPAGFHPGYDEGTGGELYDLVDVATGKAVNFSLYEWEVA